MPNVALLPDIQNKSNDTWVDQEYLGLYSRIMLTKFADYEDPMWIVYHHHRMTGTLLSDWLK